MVQVQVPNVMPVSRLSGADRFGTGVAVSQALWADHADPAPLAPKRYADSVVLARSDTFPDALAGVPLAAYRNGPLLLTDPATLTADTEAEIKRVLPPNAGKTVYLLGGDAAISPRSRRVWCRTATTWCATPAPTGTRPPWPSPRTASAPRTT
ncbi:cell wall-binding repeat-containing protein [Catenulispora yoronensis]